MKKTLVLVLLAIFLAVPLAVSAQDKPKEAKETVIVWSHYTGWEPCKVMADQVMDKWNKKKGTNIRIKLINDYIESINLYTNSGADGCFMTEMDALTIPAVAGKDSTVLAIGDYSNGNDGVVLIGGSKPEDIKGRRVLIVQFSVSHYVLTRMLAKHNLTEKVVTLVNTSDADIAALFTTEAEKGKKPAVVTWNPPLMQVRNVKNAEMVFDSSKIPGEILDCLIVRTDLPEAEKEALVGAWYETMAIMSSAGRAGQDAIKLMAESAGGTLAEFQAQLKTTRMFYEPKEALAIYRAPELKATMEYIRTFCFDKGLFGENAKNKDFIGIELPDKTILGDPKKVFLRFDPRVTEKAAKNAL